jgi:hypothetical protein
MSLISDGLANAFAHFSHLCIIIIKLVITLPGGKFTG